MALRKWLGARSSACTIGVSVVLGAGSTLKMAQASTFRHFFLKVGVLYNLKKTRALNCSYLNWDLNGRHLGYHRVQW